LYFGWKKIFKVDEWKIHSGKYLGEFIGGGDILE
jgi:hypothetical protein